MTGDQEQQWPIDEDLGALRDFLLRRASLAGLRDDRLDDLLIAVNEAVINVLEHGGGEGTVTVRHDADSITVDITDTVGALGRHDVPPRRPADAVRGFGLWLMSQLCDEFTIRRNDGRSLVRLRMCLDTVPAR
ncbi:ATP-binding protein [Streptosporangium sp. NPDC001559]|uniref:ATP-binding protein n=1 Tax=Streptosporangium sp. NPDC001559 TaxID=3366187 RepID=UPI0036E6E0F5